jgi:hypothetical protein
MLPVDTGGLEILKADAEDQADATGGLRENNLIHGSMDLPITRVWVTSRVIVGKVSFCSQVVTTDHRPRRKQYYGFDRDHYYSSIVLCCRGYAVGPR